MKNILREIKRVFKRGRIALSKLLDPEVSKASLMKDLTSLNIRGESVLVHVRFSSLGYVHGGHNALLEALLDSVDVTHSGTLLMPSFPMNTYSEIYFQTPRIFDVNSTVSQMGKITEFLRKKEGVVRSVHPSHPVLAIGKNKLFCIKDHLGESSPFNANSPFYRLIELNGKILLIGLRMSEALTSLHVLEDFVEDFTPEVYLADVLTTEVIDENDSMHKVKLKIHNSEVSKSRKCNELEKVLYDKGVFKYCKVGKAKSMLFDAERLHNALIDLYSQGVSIYNPPI